MSERSVISDWYTGQHVMVTGATGFLGKILVERLLRSCPGISVIYLLIRPKKGQEPKQRLDELLKCPVFDLIRKSPKYEFLREKLQLIPGDISAEGLNLLSDDKKMLQDNVTTIFHMAANVRFDQSLKAAVLANTASTLGVLDLVATFRQVKAFVHVSTSYCHCDQTRLEERIYKAPYRPRNILDLVNWMDDDTLQEITPKLINNAPNTYVYTKCLTEELVAEYATKIPILIARPSIVTAAWKEPIPGWVDNLNGPTGLMVGAGKGVIRTMHCNADLYVDLIPVDTVANCLVATAWKLGTTPRQYEPMVYNLVCSKDYPISWRDSIAIGRKKVYENPFSVCLWYPRGSTVSNYYAYIIGAFLLHTIPAYVVDFVLAMTRNEPFLVKTQRRIRDGLNILQYFTTHSWYFCNDNILNLYSELNETDRRIFYNNSDLSDYDSYIYHYLMGARQYCVKEEPDTLPSARKVLKRLYYLDLFAQLILGLFIGWLFLSFTKLSLWS